MNDDYQELSRYLQRLENALQQLGWWSETPPAADAFESTAPFFHDRMTFEQWLQWVFIPGFQTLIDAKAPFPEACGIAPMAEITWRKDTSENVAALIDLMSEIDSWVSRQNRA